MEKLNIGGRLVGNNEAPYIIAEIGANHNGDIELCKKLINAAKASSADAVKFQSWSKKSLISRAEYARNTQYQDKYKHFGTLEKMVEKYQLTPEMHRFVAGYCEEKAITFLSSCFSPAEVDLLYSLEVPCFKIASMDVNNLLLLEYVASKNKPVLLSTGMATLGEIERALTTLSQNGAGPIVLLHCVSIYPTPYELINLRNLTTLKDAFDVPVGFSDHSLGVGISLAAIALGACIIEKHLTLDKNMVGWDHTISADPDELKCLATEGKNVYFALGSTTRKVTEDEINKRKIMRRSIVAKHDLKKDQVLSDDDVDFKRPGTGIHPNELQYIIGRLLVRDIAADDELKWSDFI